MSHIVSLVSYTLVYNEGEVIVVSVRPIPPATSERTNEMPAKLLTIYTVFDLGELLQKLLTFHQFGTEISHILARQLEI